jgi:uncharacterized damage-inducible protein DinB
MSEPIYLADQIRRAAGGDAWHGPSLAELVDDVSAAEAAAHPFAGAHSIWELVGHITTWTDVARRRLAGAQAEPTEAENFPRATTVTPNAWAAACDAALEAHEALARAVEALPSAELLRMPVPGQTYSAYVLLHGVVQHTLYHAGQIALLKRALGTRAT